MKKDAANKKNKPVGGNTENANGQKLDENDGWRLIIDSSPDHILVLKPVYNGSEEFDDFEITNANPAIIKFLDTNPAGLRYSEFSRNGVQPGLFEMAKNAFETGTIIHKEIAYTTSGAKKKFDAYAYKSGDSLILISRDANGHHPENEHPAKRQFASAEKNKKDGTAADTLDGVWKDKDLLQSIFDASLVQMSVLEAARNAKNDIIDFRILIVNKELEKITGRTDLVGKYYAAEYPGIKESGLFDIMLRVMATGKPEGLEYYYPFEGFNKWFSCLFVRVNDGLVATNMDITERKLAEQERFSMLSLLKQTEELAGAGSWEYDIRAKNFLWSEGMYRLFNIAGNSPVQPSIYLDSVIAGDKEKALRLVNAIEKTFEPFEEIIGLKQNGKTIKIKGAPLKNASGEVDKMVGVDVDITNNLEAEFKIQELNHTLLKKNRELVSLHSELTTFNSIAVNDYKETLKKLYTIMEFIISNDARKLSNEGRANIRRAQSAIQKMKLLTEDILSYSSIHMIEAEMTDVNLNGLIDHIKEDLTKKHPEIKLTIECDSMPDMKGYPLLLSLLFHHLVMNALKFRKEEDPGVSIRIQCTRINGFHIDHADASPALWYNLISVSDNGIGFEQEHAKKIFSMFYILHDRTKYKGSGIGLAICRKIMDMHEGFITAESEVNKGATFNCYFPVQKNGNEVN